MGICMVFVTFYHDLIAYALTDKIPDQALVQAAKSGQLNSKQDYEREVRRILNDNNID